MAVLQYLYFGEEIVRLLERNVEYDSLITMPVRRSDFLIGCLMPHLMADKNLHFSFEKAKEELETISNVSVKKGYLAHLYLDKIIEEKWIGETRSDKQLDIEKMIDKIPDWPPIVSDNRFNYYQEECWKETVTREKPLTRRFKRFLKNTALTFFENEFL